MLGYYWFFAEDQYGVERIMVQCRANMELVEGAKPKMFWIVQIIFSFFPVFFVFEMLVVVPTVLGFQFNKVIRLIMLRLYLIYLFQQALFLICFSFGRLVMVHFSLFSRCLKTKFIKNQIRHGLCKKIGFGVNNYILLNLLKA